MRADHVTLSASHYTSELLGDRRIVRLVPENLQEVEDLTLETFGLAPDGAVPVGQVPNRAVGFPAWAIITDPANARHALNLVQGLQRAARKAKSKPGNARDEIFAMAELLGRSAPHFLPTFLEEGARHFIEADNLRLATQLFGRAREAERVHNLPIDEEHHRAVLLEFALAGALSAKELTAQLVRLPPDEALASYRQLTLDRARGGLPPSTTTAADLRRLIKAAKAPAEVEPEFLTELAREPAVRQAPVGFWKGFGKTLPRLAKSDPGLREVLFRISPPGGDVDGWVEVLESTGVADELRRGERDAAEWAGRMIASVSYRTDYPRRLALLLRRCVGLRGALLTLGPTQMSTEPELIDALLEAGARVELPPHGSLLLNNWCKADERADLDFLVADEPLSARINLDWLLRDKVPPAMLQHSGGRELLRRWSQPRLSEQPTLQAVWEEFDRLRPLCDLPDRTVVRDGLRAFANYIDAPELLAGALREGLLTELTWPALERAADEAAGRHEVTFHEAWPAVGVASAGEVRFVDGDRVVADARFTPPGGTNPDEWFYTLVDGVVGCLWRERSWETHLTWANDPTRHHPQGRFYGRFIRPTSSIDVGPARLCGGALQRPGDQKQVFTNPPITLSDGTTYWTLEELSGVPKPDHIPIVEVDPVSGRKGRNSLPHRFADLVTPHLRDGFRLVYEATTWRPATATTAGSLLPTLDGVHGWIALRGPAGTMRYVDVHGAILDVERESRDTLMGRISRPGGGAWTYTTQDALHTGDGSSPITAAFDEQGRRHLLHRVHVSAWHQFRARDEQASRRLRAVTARDVVGLLKASHTSGSFAHLAPTETADEQLQRPAIAAASKLLGTRDRTLAVGVAWLAAKVKHLVEEATAKLADTAPRAGTFTDWPASKDVLKWLPHAVWGEEMSRQAILGFARALREPGSFGHRGLAALPDVACRPDVLLALAAAPQRDAATIQGAAALFGALKDSGLATSRTLCTWFQKGGRGKIAYEPGSVLETSAGRGVIVRVEHHTSAHYVLWPEGNAPSHFEGAPLVTYLGAMPTLELGQVTRAFEHLLQHGGPEWDPAWADQLAEGTGWSRAAAAVFLTGMQGVGAHESNYLPKALRETLGLKVAEATAARQFLTNQDYRLLFDMYTMGAADPMALVTRGPNVEAMAWIWRERAPQKMAIPEALLDDAERSMRYGGARMLQAIVDGNPSFDSAPSMLFWLAAQLRLDDPLRGWVADQFEELAGRMRAHQWRLDHRLPDDRARFGIPPRPPGGGDTQVVGPITVKAERDFDTWTLDAAKVTDWHALVAQLDGDRPFHALPSVRRALPLLTGEIQPFLDWLRRPAEGWGQDPLRSAPATVAAVREQLGLGEDVARYWLQLLALHAPTDDAVARWNGWKKADLDRAAAPLLEQGLVIRARRARARRSHFLPGGWQEATAPHLPMEVWKAPFYGLRNTPKVEPVHESVVATVPPGELFEAAWERYVGGDRPGYEELRTQPYRRRRG